MIYILLEKFFSFLKLFAKLMFLQIFIYIIL